MPIWFTSGQQFGRDGISTKRRRPFDTVAEMDEGLIARWNEIVGPNDEIWHLGNFAQGEDRDRIAHVIARLNGSHIHFVASGRESCMNWPSRSAAKSSVRRLKIDDREVIISNDFGASRLCSRGGPVWLFGFRNQWWETSASCSVHVDAWDFGPVSFAQIAARLERRTSPPR